MDKGTRKRIASLTLALVLVTPLSVVAARWQWSRHLERDALNQAVLTAERAEPVAWQRLLADGYAPSDEWRRVTAVGSWEAGGQLLVRKQVVDRAVGFTVMTPFRTEDGTLLFVVRGWVASADDVIPAPPSGDTRVVLRIRAVSGEGPMGAADLPAGQVNRLDPKALAAGRTYAPALFELMDPVPEGMTPLPWPELTDGPHVSYTVQWILIGLTGIVVYIRVFRSEWRISKGEADPAADA